MSFLREKHKCKSQMLMYNITQKCLLLLFNILEKSDLVGIIWNINYSVSILVGGTW